MRDCLLTVYGEGDRVLGEHRVVLPPLPEQVVLERIFRESIKASKKFRYAVAREERDVRAIFLKEDLVPMATVRVGGRKRAPGRWLTTAVQVGEHLGGRAFAGPDVFVRQVDVGGTSAWLARLLIRFGMDVDVRELRFGHERLYAWELRNERFFYRARGGRWSLYGAGNTPEDRLDRVLEQRSPETAAEYLWAVGAVRLG